MYISTVSITWIISSIAILCVIVNHFVYSYTYTMCKCKAFMLYILYLCNVYSENGSSKVNFNLIADIERLQWKFPSWLLVILYPDKAISVFVPTGFFWGAIFGLIFQFSIIHEIHLHKSRVDLAGSDLWSFYQFTLLGVCVFMYLYQNNVIHEEDGIPPTFNGFCVFLYIL